MSDSTANETSTSILFSNKRGRSYGRKQTTHDYETILKKLRHSPATIQVKVRKLESISQSQSQSQSQSSEFKVEDKETKIYPDYQDYKLDNSVWKKGWTLLHEQCEKKIDFSKATFEFQNTSFQLPIKQPTVPFFLFDGDSDWQEERRNSTTEDPDAHVESVTSITLTSSINIVPGKTRCLVQAFPGQWIQVVIEEIQYHMFESNRLQDSFVLCMMSAPFDHAHTHIVVPYSSMPNSPQRMVQFLKLPFNQSTLTHSLILL